MPFLKEEDFGMDSRKGCVERSVKECVIEVIPSKSIQNSVTSYQLRGFSYMQE